jgi:hypothetical protein
MVVVVLIFSVLFLTIPRRTVPAKADVTMRVCILIWVLRNMHRASCALHTVSSLLDLRLRRETARGMSKSCLRAGQWSPPQTSVELRRRLLQALPAHSASSLLRLCYSLHRMATLKKQERPVLDATSLWSTIQTALDELFHPLVDAADPEQVPSASVASPKIYMEAYSAVFNWTTSSDRSLGWPAGAAVYKRVDNYLEGVCKTLSSRLLSTADSATSLQTYSTTYDTYRKQLAIAARLLAYTDRHYVKLQVDEGHGWFQGGRSDRAPDDGRTSRKHPAPKEETVRNEERAELVKYWGLFPDAPDGGKDFAAAVLRAEAGTPAGVCVSIMATGLRQWRLQIITALQNAEPGLLSRLANAEDEALKAQVLQSLRDAGVKQDVDAVTETSDSVTGHNVAA